MTGGAVGKRKKLRDEDPINFKQKKKRKTLEKELMLAPKGTEKELEHTGLSLTLNKCNEMNVKHKEKEVIEKEEMMTLEECENEQGQHAKKRDSSFTLNKCNRMNSEHKNWEVIEKEQMITQEERERRLNNLFKKRKKLLDKMSLLDDDYQSYLDSWIGGKIVWDVQDGHQNRNMEMGEKLIRSYENLVEKMKIYLKRLTLIDEKMKVLSEGMDRNYFKRVYKQGKKKEKTLILFKELRSAALSLKIYDHLKALTSIQFICHSEEFWTDVKKELEDKFPSASEEEMKPIVMEYVYKSNVKYLGELEYEYCMFLLSLKHVDYKIRIYDILKSIKDHEFEMKFGELSYTSLLDGLTKWRCWMEIGKPEGYEKAIKKDYQMIKEKGNYLLSSPARNVVFQARQKGYEINLDGDPEKVVSEMNFFFEDLENIIHT